MKKLILFIVLFFVFIINLSAQNYSVSVTSGSSLSAYSVYDNTTSIIRITFTYSGQKANVSNIWKFRISFGYPIGTGLHKSGETEQSWTDENNPYFDLRANILLPHYCRVYMHEFTSTGTDLGQRASSAGQEITPMQRINVTSENGEQISVNSNNVNSGASFDLSPNQSLNLYALDNVQSPQGYTMVWGGTSKWYLNNSLLSTYRSTSYTANRYHNGAVITPRLSRLFYPTFANSFGAGSITVNGSSIPSGNSVATPDGNTVTITANWQTYNGIEYSFSRWQDYSTTNPVSVSVSSNIEYTAHFTGKPVVVNYYFGGETYSPIKVIWTDNPNTAVTQYYIYRQSKINGVFTNPVHIGTVGRNVGYFEDLDYTLAYAKNGIWLEYKVVSYYSTEGTFSDGGWSTVWGNISAKTETKDIALFNTETEVPADYSISNYPNPFNPTTTINYQLPKDGVVSIKVYDVLGKEVAALVNEQKSAGYYKVEFNGNGLTSGLYICSIQAGSFSKSIKLMLTK